MGISRNIAGSIAMALGLAAATAQATTVCSVTDITPTAEACAGFYDGNLLSGSPAGIAAQTSALALLGLTWDQNFAAVEKVGPLSGATNIDFAAELNGTTYIGVHYGGGNGGPGNATAFYRFDAGTNLDSFTLNYGASSDAVLYSTTPSTTPPVPEPETYALMLGGLGVVGWLARRRRT
jgi:hypothetical protein